MSRLTNLVSIAHNPDWIGLMCRADEAGNGVSLLMLKVLWDEKEAWDNYWGNA